MGTICGIERKLGLELRLEREKREQLELELAIERQARKKAQAKVRQIQNLFIEGNMEAAEQDLLTFDITSPRRS